MQNIPIQLLYSFVVFNESANISQAAVSIGITQPGLSKQLKALENLVEEALFTMSGRRKVLTPFGRKLHERLKARIGNIQDLIRETTNLYALADLANLRIVGRRGLLDRVSEKLTFPGTIHFNERSSTEVIEDLLGLKADIGITYQLPDSPELIVKPLFEEKFQVVTPKAFRVRRRNSGKALLCDLMTQPCVGFGANDEVLHRICRLYGCDPLHLKILRTTANYPSLARMVEAKLGWAVLPTYLPLDEKVVWTSALSANQPSIREFFLAYRKDLARIPWFRDLTAEIKRCFG